MCKYARMFVCMEVCILCIYQYVSNYRTSYVYGKLMCAHNHAPVYLLVLLCTHVCVFVNR